MENQQFAFVSDGPKPPLVSFRNQDNKVIGILDIVDDKLVFSGNVEESAKIFFDQVIAQFVKAAG